MKILHIYPTSIEYAYPAYNNLNDHPDRFDEEIVCNTDLEVRYLSGLHELGEDCVLFYPRARKLKIKEFIHRGGYRVVRFPVTFFTGKTGKEYPLKMLFHIKKEKPDIVHYHHIYGGGKLFYIRFFLLVGIVCRFYNIPLVGWYHIGSMQRGKKARFFDRIPVLSAIETKLRILPLKLCSGLTSINHSELERLFDKSHPDHYGFSLEKLPFLLTSNTFNPDYFYEMDKAEAMKKTGLNPAKKYFIMVSRLFYQKGLHYLLEAFARIKLQYPDIELLVVGEFEDGTTEYKYKIERRIEELKIQKSVHLLGRIEHHQGLVLYLNAAEAFVLPTFMDSFAAVNIEAMACGLPVISTDREEIPYYLTRDTGILVPEHDTKALTAAMISILDGSFKINHTKRKEIIQQYNYLVAAKKLQEWYHLIIENA